MYRSIADARNYRGFADAFRSRRQQPQGFKLSQEGQNKAPAALARLVYIGASVLFF